MSFLFFHVFVGHFLTCVCHVFVICVWGLAKKRMLKNETTIPKPTKNEDF